MRLLENLLSGMIRNSTGIDARRLVRRIGGRNLLLAGGAAVAGALAVEHFAKRSHAGSAPPGAPAAVPPPPPPPAAVPPPLPPETALPPLPPPTAGDDEPELPGSILFAIVRTMAAAALADGEMTAEERTAVESRLEGSGLSDEQIRRIRKDLVLPPSPHELAAMLTDLPPVAGREARETLYRAAAAVLRADQEVSESERAWLAELRVALDLTAERTAELTAEVFD